MRDKKAKPLLDQSWKWISSFHSLSGSNLGKAVGYALNNRNGLMNFLLDGRCALSNNLAERSIRPTTIGRKNWNFSASLRGATASGIVYSLVATAKANGLIPRSILNSCLSICQTSLIDSIRRHLKIICHGQSKFNLLLDKKVLLQSFPIN